MSFRTDLAFNIPFLQNHWVVGEVNANKVANDQRSVPSMPIQRVDLCKLQEMTMTATCWSRDLERHCRKNWDYEMKCIKHGRAEGLSDLWMCFNEKMLEWKRVFKYHAKDVSASQSLASRLWLRLIQVIEVTLTPISTYNKWGKVSIFRYVILSSTLNAF